jgi:sterol desaturase/sphingolipid hydroxylase (fatty acid hydroxylase superfamily)
VTSLARTRRPAAGLFWLAAANVAGIALVLTFAYSAEAYGAARELCNASVPSSLCEKILRPYYFLYFGIATLGLLPTAWLAEYFMPAKPAQPMFSAGLAHDAVWYLAFPFLLVLIYAGYTAGLSSFYENRLGFLKVGAIADLPTPVQIALVIAGSDFLAWLHHLVRHKVSVLWQFHKVHHSAREMNYLTDIRIHPIDFLTAKTIEFIPFYSLSLDMAVPTFIVWEIFRTWLTRFYHANIRTDFGWLRHVLVTPQSHRIHHSRNPHHYDHNFGVTFSIWDFIFGTQYKNFDEYPDTGVEDGFPVEGRLTLKSLLLTPIRQLIHPFTLLLKGSRGELTRS